MRFLRDVSNIGSLQKDLADFPRLSALIRYMEVSNSDHHLLVGG